VKPDVQRNVAFEASHKAALPLNLIYFTNRYGGYPGRVQGQDTDELSEACSSLD